MTQVYVELNETVDRIDVSFPYSSDDVARINGKRPDEFGSGVKGRRWDPDKRNWTVPMDLKTARQLRTLFGERLKLGPALRAWAREQVNIENNLRSLHSASDAELKNTPGIILDAIAGEPLKAITDALPPKHPFRRKRPARPYQRADIAMLAMSNAINGNDVGTGKTLEAIGAVFEAQLYPKPILIVAPRRSLEAVWQTEFERFSDYGVWTSENAQDRNKFIEDFINENHHDRLVLALIANDLRLEKYRDIKKDKELAEDPLHACKDYKGNWYRYTSEVQQALFATHWGAFIVDEFHRSGLNTRTSLFHVSAQHIKADRRWPMSGTPIGGKARRLWPILNFIAPKEYSSEWRWIGDWLEVNEETFYKKGDRPGNPSGIKREVGGIRKDVEEEFYDHHKMHMTRRTKRDALPGLPPMIELLVEIPMEGKQRAEYDKFDKEHEIVLNGKRLSGSIVLAQYIRLRQLANSSLTHDGKRWTAKQPSNKLDVLLDKLYENGIRSQDPEPGARAYIGVIDKSYLTIVIDFLRKNGIDCARLDGDTKDSAPMLDRFEDGSEAPFVIAMTIQTGGTALNLGAANSAHALDEDWDPDVMYQFFGRGDRGSRETALRCYTYRTVDSIQEYVASVAEGKKITNKNVIGFASEIEKLRRK